MTSFVNIVVNAKNLGASDVFIVSGREPSCKAGKGLVALGDEKIMPDSAHVLLAEAYAMASRNMSRLSETGDDDFALSIPGLARLRISAYKQRSSLAAVVRIVSFGIPNNSEIGIPESVMRTATFKKGLVLVTGSAGSGKSTTLACIIDRINHTREGHIITLEDPIEFLYRNDRCIVSQREVEMDTRDYVTAIRASLRQAPDVILLGEMRDYETIKTAMTAAETGHLVLSTLHTVGAGNTIDRIIDIFPPNQQQQIRVQLAMLLNTVVSQQLIPAVGGGVVPAFEIMHVNSAIRNMIRESKSHQIANVIATSGSEGMQSMDASLLELFKAGRITRESALYNALQPDMLEKRL